MSIPALNKYSTIEVDVNPNGTAKYVLAGDGLTDYDTSNNDSELAGQYLDGSSYSTVTSHQKVYTVTGERIYGDDFQDFVDSASDDDADARITKAKFWDGTGKCRASQVSLVNPVVGGGEAGGAAAFSVEMKLVGEVTITDPAPATVITATASLAAGLVTITHTPAEGNKTKYIVTSAALDTPNNMTFVPSNSRDYVAPFASVAGKYVNIFEVKYGYKVVGFKSVLLA